MAQTDPKRPSALPPPMGAPSNIVTEIVDQITEKQSRATCRPDPLPPTASFPFGFPQTGLYRLWVQMKRDGRVYTGVFDVRVN